MEGIISTLTQGVTGVFMVCISFAGVALGFVKRAFRTARK